MGKEQVSGQEASSRSVSSCSVHDLSNVANTGIYGFEDYHGIDLGVVRAVRVWYVPNFSEISVRLKVEDDESRIGLGISQTEEVPHFSQISLNNTTKKNIKTN